MKKNAFTLGEVLISLCVIGVAAAILAPSVTKLVPNKNKVRVLSYYNQISNAVEDFLDNNLIYYTTYNNGVATCSGGLSCTGLPLIEPYKTAAESGGDNKFPNLLRYALGADGSTLPDGSTIEITKSGESYTVNITLSGTSEVETFVIGQYGEVGCTGKAAEYVSSPLELQ
jgi:type II secretory pathway pseudopilin PulG